jgi:MFS family permease
MNGLYRDRRFCFIVAANILSSIGSGITMIAIPWLLASGENGGTVFGYAAIAMTIINFAVTPFLGQLIDRFSRKRILLFGEGAGFIIIAAFSAAGYFGLDYETVHLMILYGAGSLYYTLFYPAIFAFNQEIFDPSHYRRLNGAMEIQGQLSSVAAGALAAAFISTVPLEQILLIDALTYMGAFGLFWLIPYTSGENSVKKQGAVKAGGGLLYLKARPVLFVFLFASMMPFIGVMVTNYLFPVYIADILQADASVYGTQSMIYGIGAALAGLAVPAIASRWGNERSIILTIGAYTAAISVIVFIKDVPVFLSLAIFLAFGNAGTRVARNALMMEMVPNHLIGRTDSLFRSMGLLIRTLLLIVFTGLSGAPSIALSFYILSFLLIFSFAAAVIAGKLLFHEGQPEKTIGEAKENTA